MSNKYANQIQYPFSLPELPYDSDALEPHMSSRTFSYHHGKHHLAYVNNLNKLIENTDLAKKNLEEIILAVVEDKTKQGVFNNAAQIWNHSFFWHCMKPDGGGVPKNTLLEQINKDFGSYDKFCEDFRNAGISQFGSGWVWLVLDHGKLKIEKTANADTPLARKQIALLTCDVWEHSYYLDYQNARPDYIGVFLNKLVNWEFVEKNFTNT